MLGKLGNKEIIFSSGHTKGEGNVAFAGSAMGLSSWAVIFTFFFFTYHSCFCNRTKAVDENVAADVHWWACMTNTDWNSSSLCAYMRKYFHSMVLKPIVGIGRLRGQYGNKIWVTQLSLVLCLMPV